ncbi:hypothetical protein Tco_0344936 [Tanacetum coccineum]
MANLKYSDKHNMVAFLKKPNESVGFTEVVDFLKGTSLRYALTHNPTIYDSLVKQFWQTATVRTLANGTQQLVASIDSKEYTITEASVRSKLQLADATGIHNLSDAEIYAGLATLGYVTEGDIVPLLPAMLAGAAMDQGKGSAQPAEPHHTPVDPISSTSQPPIPSPIPSPPHPSPPPHSPLQSPPHSPLQSPPHSPPHSPHQSPPFSPPHFSPPRSYEAPLPEGNALGSAEDSMQLKELMVLVPTLKVKSLEKALKKSKKVLVSESEGEESEDQGRKSQDIDVDPLVSLVRESIKEKSIDFVTPTKASGEAHEEEISPTILEAAKTLSKVASQGVSKEKLTDKGNRYRRRARSMAKKIDTGLDVEEEINTVLVLKRAKLEANAELTKDVLGKDFPEQDFAKRMAEMVNQRKKHFAEERAKAKRNKPMTQSQLRIYMSNYLKNQGTWKLSQLKKLKFEEIKEEFDKLVQQIDTFVPINLEATKAKLKRYGEELQTKISKKQRFDDKDVPAIGEKVVEVKEEEPVKRTGKRKKQKARKGINVDKSAYDDSED